MTADEPRIELATRAVRDLRRIDGPQRAQIRRALGELAAGADNADVKRLAGAGSAMRLRVGHWRVLYRPLTEREAAAGGSGLLIARVVNRRDPLRAVRTLPT